MKTDTEPTTPRPFDPDDASTIIAAAKAIPAITGHGRAACFEAINRLWPDHFTDLEHFTRRIEEVKAQDAASRSKRFLVPVRPGEMRPGNYYVALTTKATTGVGAFCFGTTEGQTKASQYEEVYQILVAP